MIKRVLAYQNINSCILQSVVKLEVTILVHTQCIYEAVPWRTSVGTDSSLRKGMQSAHWIGKFIGT